MVSIPTPTGWRKTVSRNLAIGFLVVFVRCLGADELLLKRRDDGTCVLWDLDIRPVCGGRATVVGRGYTTRRFALADAAVVEARYEREYLEAAEGEL